MGDLQQHKSGLAGKTAGISRRAFLSGTVATAAVAGIAGLTGCSTARSEGESTGATDTTTSSTPAFFTPPVAPAAADLVETLDCDVLVVGLGISGIAATRSAVESGAKVIAVEKGENIGLIGYAGDFGVVGSKIQKDLGMTLANRGDTVNALMKSMTCRPNPRLLNYWYDHSGEAFDWFIEGADYDILTHTSGDHKKENYIRPKCWPPLEGYDWREELYPYLHGCLNAQPSYGWALENSRQIAEKAGAKLIFSTWAEQLIRDESGAVIGAYIHDAESNYSRINAKSVVLCCGDFANSKELREYFVPEAAEFLCIYPIVDATGTPCNTGDGHKMGIWAGGHMELGPLGPMTHHMGGALGIDSFLQLNLEGERFMNEDVPGQNIADQLSRQPGTSSWQIFDARWPEQLTAQPTGHGYVNYYVPDDQIDTYKTILAGFGTGYTTSAMVEESVTCKADSIEELAGLMELPVEKVVAEIERYNDLCEKGIDEDFGKVASRMFPVATPPFYACKFDQTVMLVCMGGLECDLDLHVLDAEKNAIPGLYVAGNTMGGRFLVEYPSTVAGISLGSAMVFGRLAGTNAATGV